MTDQVKAYYFLPEYKKNNQCHDQGNKRQGVAYGERKK